MTSIDSITPVVESQPAFAVSDLLESVRLAQAAGNYAHQIAEQANMNREDCADAYHMAFADTMRATGSPMPCACDYCRVGWLA